MAVLKTTSPQRSAGAPKLLPSKTDPSSRARIAESDSSSSLDWGKAWVWGKSHCSERAILEVTGVTISMKRYAFFALAAAPLFGQGPAFDVATIKLSPPITSIAQQIMSGKAHIGMRV